MTKDDTFTIAGVYATKPRAWWAFWRNPRSTGVLKKFKVVGVVSSGAPGTYAASPPIVAGVGA